MVDLRTLEALLRFDPLPEDVKRRMIRLDDGDGVVTFSPACRGGGFLLKNPSGFSIDRLSPHALWFARFMSRATR